MKHDLTIALIIEGDHEPLTILVKINLVLEDTRLLHVFISSTQNGDEVVHQKDVGEEDMADQQYRVRQFSVSHVIIVIVRQCSVKESSNRDSKSSKLRWVSVLVQGGEYR